MPLEVSQIVKVKIDYMVRMENDVLSLLEQKRQLMDEKYALLAMLKELMDDWHAHTGDQYKRAQELIAQVEGDTDE